MRRTDISQPSGVLRSNEMRCTTPVLSCLWQPMQFATIARSVIGKPRVVSGAGPPARPPPVPPRPPRWAWAVASGSVSDASSTRPSEARLRGDITPDIGRSLRRECRDEYDLADSLSSESEHLEANKCRKGAE